MVALTTRAWRLATPGGALSLDDVVILDPRPGTVRVRMEGVPLLSYLGAYLEGTLPYWYPPSPFTPGTNGVGIVEAVGPDVLHLRQNQRVAVNPYLVAAEVTDDPAQILIGLTGISPDCSPMLDAWRNGTLADHVLMPASVLVPLDGLDHVPSERLATLGKFVVPLGGLLRGRLAPGESLIVNGATGYFGSAAVLLGQALGAERIVAIGRSRPALEALAETVGPRVVPVAATGDAEADTRAIRAALGGRGAHLAFDQVGNADDPSATLASLKALRRGGRLVLMGSMNTPLPLTYGDVMLNNWEIIGNFMYGPAAYPTAVALVRAGLLDLDRVRLRTLPLGDLPAALKQAKAMRGLDCTVVTMQETETH